MSWRKIVLASRNFIFPKPAKPPYLHVCQIGDPVLRANSAEVPKDEIISPETQQIISCMRKVMKMYKCMGIAAPQIGIPKRIIAYELPEKIAESYSSKILKAREMKSVPLTVIINPVVTVKDYDTTSFSETCTSFLGFSAVVPRYKSIVISGYNPKGKLIEFNAQGWTARIIQHEIDHLNGRLFVDLTDTKTLQNDAWHRINIRQGRVEIKHDG